ncbi:helicase [Bifidobacterium tissieri]|uniref:helicase n=1 Tax=Bifidobacterium tissieri TaxID=1630162 RepID=UPI001238D353|nr:helicase [Bifidobacterium tissieri]KAA8832603.1 helicase [Bifidobacterium tissieri]
MADEAVEQQAQEPNGEAQKQPEIDWKAKYEETLAHSREWEKRAKANKTAADELQQLKESQMSEQQKAEARTARLQKELDQLKAEKQMNAWRSQVAEESKLPASLVFGSTLEEMQANAKAIGEYVAEKMRPAVHVPGEGKQPSQPPSGASGDWLRDEFLHNK